MSVSQVCLSANLEKRTRSQIRRRHKPPFTIIMRSLSLQARSNKNGPQLRAPRSRTQRFHGGPSSPRAPVGVGHTCTTRGRRTCCQSGGLPVSRRLLQSPKHQRLSKSGLHTIMRYQKSKIRNSNQAGAEHVRTCRSRMHPIHRWRR